MQAKYVYNNTLKSGGGFRLEKKELFEGLLSGTVTSDLLVAFKRSTGYQFSIKLDKKIEGIPIEFLVYSYSNFHLVLRKGDELLIEGKLFQSITKKLKLEIIEMEANHIYNTSLKCGG
ncbi:MAG: hypothetical protein ACFFCM_05875 [Promethearchaeota archaeon]